MPSGGRAAFGHRPGRSLGAALLARQNSLLDQSQPRLSGEQSEGRFTTALQPEGSVQPLVEPAVGRREARISWSIGVPWWVGRGSGPRHFGFWILDFGIRSWSR